MPVVHRLDQRMENASPRPNDRVEGDAELLGDGIRRLEADPVDVFRQRVGVGPHGFDRGLAVGFVDADRPARADAVGVKEDHDLADDLLLRPGGLDFQPPLLADPGNFLEAGGKLVDDREDSLVEFLHELLCVNRPDPLDEPAAEILFDALSRRGRAGLDEVGFELQAVIAVLDPGALRGHPLARRDIRHIPDHRDQVALPLDFHPQNRKTGLVVVIGDPLHHASHSILRGRFARLLGFHGVAGLSENLESTQQCDGEAPPLAKCMIPAAI